MSLPLRILIVDDDLNSVSVLSTMLKRRGFEVQTQTDSAQVLRDAIDFQPHVVILDYIMPGFYGAHVAWQLAGTPLLHNVRVIIVSASSAEEIRRNLPPTRIPILPKPIDFVELLTLIREEGSAPRAMV